MKTLTVLLLFFLGQEREQCLQLDIVVLADFSESVRGHEPYIYSALSDFADSFQIDDQEVRMGVVVFNIDAFVALEITGRRKDIDAFITKNALYAVGSTAMDKGFQVAYEQFGVEYEGMADRSAAKKIIIVVSDGDVNDSVLTLAIAQNIQQQGIDVFGVLINNMTAKPDFMRQISSPNKFVSTDYERLGEELNKLNFCL